MDTQHRDLILSNIDYLKSNTKSFDALFNSLKAKGMFNDFMENEIKSVSSDLLLPHLYWYVTTRGPTAFHTLITALNDTDHKEVAKTLQERSRVTQLGNSSNKLSLEEEFPDDDLEWVVKRTFFPSDLDREDAYKMDSNPRGLALIINNRVFINNTQEERLGSEKDIKRLKSILQQIGYTVFIHENKKAQEMLNIVKEFSNKEEHSECDSTVVVVMSHNTANKPETVLHTINISGVDFPNSINSEQLVKPFIASNCVPLRGKPKVFIFQVCRGDQMNYLVKLNNNGHFENGNDKDIRNGESDIFQENEHTMRETHSFTNTNALDFLNTQTDGTKNNTHPSVRSDSDIFIAYATSNGCVAHRDPTTGSFFIQSLCRVFAKHAWRDDLDTMLQRVLQKGIPISKSKRGFNKKLYFQPGFSRPRLESFGS